MPIWIVLARQTSVVAFQWKLLQRDTSDTPHSPRSAESVYQPPQGKFRSLLLRRLPPDSLLQTAAMSHELYRRLHAADGPPRPF